MILTPGTVLRVGLLVLLVVLLQVSALSQIRVFGASADLVPLAVAAIGLFGGSVPGAAAGFATGLLLDLSLGVNLGASSLVLTGVGYGAGRFRETRDPAHGLVAIPVGAAATAAYLLGIGLVNFMLEIGAEVSPLVFRDILVTTLVNAVIAVAVFAIARRVLQPALIGDALSPRGRRARTTDSGPIGLRGLEV